MYLNECATRDALLKIIRTITQNEGLQEDLLQEALIHLWLMETRRPEQTKSWYLQSCKFHLLHYLSSGRSVDSAKRRKGRVVEAAADDWMEEIEPVDADAAVFTSVCAQDLILLLGKHLSSPERAVLYCLADGLGAREIGRELGISHSMAIKHRRKIAALLTPLEKPPIRSLTCNNGAMDLKNRPVNGATGHFSKLPSSRLLPTAGNGNCAGEAEVEPRQQRPRIGCSAEKTESNEKRHANGSVRATGAGKAGTGCSKAGHGSRGNAPRNGAGELPANRLLDISIERSLMTGL